MAQEPPNGALQIVAVEALKRVFADRASSALASSGHRERDKPSVQSGQPVSSEPLARSRRNGRPPPTAVLLDAAGLAGPPALAGAGQISLGLCFARRR